MIKMQPVTAECYACTLSVMLVHCTVLKYGEKKKEKHHYDGSVGADNLCPTDAYSQ